MRTKTYQNCDNCANPVEVNAVSPSECFCSAECHDEYQDRLDSQKDNQDGL